MKEQIKRITDRILDLIYPPKCPCCGEIIQSEKDICDECRRKLVKWTGSFRIKGADSFNAAYRYDETISPAVIKLKNQSYGKACDFLVKTAVKLIKENTSGENRVIVPVPLHEYTLKERGYNQSEVIAKEAGRILGIPVDTSSLVKVRETLQQKTLTPERRKLNLREAFCVSEGSDISGKSVILLDDVCTTGSTLSECAAALKEAGAAKIYCIAAAKVQKRDK